MLQQSFTKITLKITSLKFDSHIPKANELFEMHFPSMVNVYNHVFADLGLRLANERLRYKVTPSLIGWAQT